MSKTQEAAVEQQRASDTSSPGPGEVSPQPPRKSIGARLFTTFKQPGSALQIVTAAVLAIIIGVTATTQSNDVHPAVSELLVIPGSLWLRALRATVLPLIVCAIVLAMQTLKEMVRDGKKLAIWTISYYVATTILAVVHSMILVDLVWTRLMSVADQETLDKTDAKAEQLKEDPLEWYGIIVQVAESFVPNNVVGALANDELLAVLVTSIVVGLMIKGPDSPLIRAVKEVESIIAKVIEFLIKLAPIGVFFLILANLFKLDIEEAGVNIGILVGGSVAGMFIHMFIVLPLVFFAFTRENPFSLWIRCSRAWITAWGTASSAATLPVTIRCLEEQKIPTTVIKFTAPLGCLINMDGTAIYFPMVVVFLAVTNGDTLNVGDYALIVILSVLSSIATTPIPSSSLVLTIMIANSVGVEVTGMYAVVVAIDWLIDRFRTATNVSGDIFAARILTKVTGIVEDDKLVDIPSTEQHREGVAPPLRVDDSKV